MNFDLKVKLELLKNLIYFVVVVVVFGIECFIDFLFDLNFNFFRDNIFSCKCYIN